MEVKKEKNVYRQDKDHSENERHVLKFSPGGKRFKVIACEILFREVCRCAADSKNIIDPVFMAKGLHDIGEAKMTTRLQKEIDAVDPDKYDAILLVYGLCNNGVRGLSARLPLVIPRAHDCITLLMGSKEEYQRYFNEKAGTYFKSTGWIERDEGFIEGEDGTSITSQLGMNRTYAEYVEAYGEENAAYLMETLGDWLHQYHRLAYIDTNTGDKDANIEQTRQQAEERGWEYETLQGDTRLISQLFSGEWPEAEFLVVEPDEKIMPSYDEDVVKSQPD